MTRPSAGGSAARRPPSRGPPAHRLPAGRPWGPLRLLSGGPLPARGGGLGRRGALAAQALGTDRILVSQLAGRRWGRRRGGRRPAPGFRPSHRPALGTTRRRASPAGVGGSFDRHRGPDRHELSEPEDGRVGQPDAAVGDPAWGGARLVGPWIPTTPPPGRSVRVGDRALVPNTSGPYIGLEKPLRRSRTSNRPRPVWACPELRLRTRVRNTTRPRPGTGWR